MRRIGLSQRVDIILSYGERRDCLDQRWSALLAELAMMPVPIPNGMPNPDMMYKNFSLDGFILTGGNDLSILPDAANPASERDRTEALILDYALEHQLPVLGVCRGLQMINVFLGGRLSPVQGHVSVRHSLSVPDSSTAYLQYSEVNSFHGWGVEHDGLGADLEAAVFAEDGTVEAFYHKRLPWLGIMWHPERENPFIQQDLTLIKDIFSR